MGDDGFGNVKGLDEFLPGRPIEIEDGLVFLNALFFDLGDFTRVGGI